MDPFSITVGAIGLAGAANKATGSVIKQLKTLRDAPKELQDLLAELSQFEDILQAIQGAADPSEITHSPLETLLDTAKDKILELHRLIEYRLTKAGTSSEVDRSQWAGSQKDVDRLRKQLTNLRASLHVNLSINTNKTLEDTSRLLRQVNSDNHAMGQMAAALLPQILQEVQSVAGILDNFPHLTLESSRSNLQSVPDTANDKSLAQTGIQNAYGRSNRQIQPRKTHKRPHCRSDCPCECHRTYYSSTPWPLTRLLGCVYVERKGPSSVGASHHIQSCKASAVSQIRVIYIVPIWFAMKAYVIRYTSSPLHAPEWLIKIPRLVDLYENRAFQAAIEGDLPTFRSLIANGECTPYDIWDEAFSMISFLVETYNFEFLAHLAGMGVDLCQSVDADPCWLDFIWNVLTVDVSAVPKFRESWCLPDLFSRFPFDEYIADEGFTLLHEIVCHFNGRDLDSALQTHSADVNEINKAGKSPLEMAVQLQNIAAVRMLLRHGADPNINDGTPVVLALSHTDFGLVDLLLRSGAIIHGPAGDKAAKQWIEWWATSKNDAEAAIDRLIIEYGIDVNRQVLGITKLMTLCQWRSRSSEIGIDRIEQLIDFGADLELRDTQGYTALHFAICAENSKAIKTLLHLGARIDVKTNEGNTIAHLAIIYSKELKMTETMSEMDLGRLDLNLKNEDGHTVFDLLRKRNGLGWEAYYTEWAYGDEYALILALEALLHHIQDLQGVPKDQQYPALGEYLSDDKDEDPVPGAWPV